MSSFNTSQPATATPPPAMDQQQDAGGSVHLEVANYHPSVHVTPAGVSAASFTSLIHLEAPALPPAAAADNDGSKNPAVEEDRKPLQVSAVLDVSGSMNGEKIALAKEALAFLVSELGPKDKFGLVTFGSDVVEEQRPTFMDAAGQEGLTATVRGLRTRGCTNLSGGLFAGIAQASGDGSAPVEIPAADRIFRGGGCPRRGPPMKMAMQQQQQLPQMQRLPSPPQAQQQSQTPSLLTRVSNFFRSNKTHSDANANVVTGVPIVDATATDDKTTITFAAPEKKAETTCPTPSRRRRVVLLFTDGQANEGITGVEALTSATQQKLAEQPEDVTVFTFGFGSDHDATLLRRLAECSEGSYYFIESARDMKEIFADCLGGLLSIVAEKIRVQIKPLLAGDAAANFSCDIATVATHFPIEKSDDGKSFTVKVKDLYAEEKRDILVILSLKTSGCKVGDVLNLANVDLTYQNPITSTSVSRTAVISTAVADGGPYNGPVDERVDEQLARHKAVEAMKTAQQYADDGDVSRAKQILQAQVAETERMSCQTTPVGRGLAEELRNAMKDVQDVSHYRAVGQKKMAMKQSAHAQQRSNAVCMEEQACQMYQTNCKRSMQTKSAGFSLY